MIFLEVSQQVLLVTMMRLGSSSFHGDHDVIVCLQSDNDHDETGSILFFMVITMQLCWFIVSLVTVVRSSWFSVLTARLGWPKVSMVTPMRLDWYTVSMVTMMCSSADSVFPLFTHRIFQEKKVLVRNCSCFLYSYTLLYMSREIHLLGFLDPQMILELFINRSCMFSLPSMPSLAGCVCGELDWLLSVQRSVPSVICPSLHFIQLLLLFLLFLQCWKWMECRALCMLGQCFGTKLYLNSLVILASRENFINSVD